MPARSILTRFLLPTAVAAAIALLVASAGSDGSGGGGGAAQPRGVATGQPAASREASAARVPRRPDVILLVFDEFPSDSLLGPDGRIDAGRFPNFARLAADGTWFRDAYASYDSTTKAVPLVVDGIRPKPGTSPTPAYRPRSIFDMFGRRDYRVVASEEATALCPRRLCRGARTRRPAIIPNL